VPTAVWYNIFCVPVCYMKTIKTNEHKTVILPLRLYGCETGLSCEGKFENRLTRKTSEPKSEAVTES
jgi:hypothetical protein